MDLNNYTDRSLDQMEGDIKQLQQHFMSIMDAERLFSGNRPLLSDVAMTTLGGSESIKITRGCIAIDLLLTYSHYDGNRLVGRVSAVLSKHPLEPEPVLLDWFTLHRNGQADLRVLDHVGDMPALAIRAHELVLTLIDRALTHVPTES